MKYTLQAQNLWLNTNLSDYDSKKQYGFFPLDESEW